jgi:chromate transporter
MTPIPAQPALAELFLSFLRLGAGVFGGSAMVANIRRMAVEEKRWLEAGAFDDGVALCQVIPGATAMQAAAYVGLNAGGTVEAFQVHDLAPESGWSTVRTPLF